MGNWGYNPTHRGYTAPYIYLVTGPTLKITSFDPPKNLPNLGFRTIRCRPPESPLAFRVCSGCSGGPESKLEELAILRIKRSDLDPKTMKHEGFRPSNYGLVITPKHEGNVDSHGISYCIKRTGNVGASTEGILYSSLIPMLHENVAMVPSGRGPHQTSVRQHIDSH